MYSKLSVPMCLRVPPSRPILDIAPTQEGPVDAS